MYTEKACDLSLFLSSKTVLKLQQILTDGPIIIKPQTLYHKTSKCFGFDMHAWLTMWHSKNIVPQHFKNRSNTQ